MTTFVAKRLPWLSERRGASFLLLLASVLFRLPPLLNARSTNSDAAVVGLQAIHILRGEFSPFLWGSGYQTSADSFVTAAFFAVFGAAPLTLMMSSLALHITSTFLVFSVLGRRFSPLSALLIVMPLVVSPSSIHSYALYPPRQLSLTLAVGAFWALDTFSTRSALTSRRSLAAWLFTSGALATLAVAADPYPMLLLPMFALYAAITVGTKPHRACGFVTLVAGLAVGIVPFFAVHHAPGAKSGPMGLTTSMLAHHFRLLREECLPWALSYKVYYAHHVMDYRAWDAPPWFRVIGVVGATLLGGIVIFGLGSVTRASIPASTRAVGFVGALTFPVAIAAFLVSVMVMDHFSMRYLAVLTLMTPFAAVPLAHVLGTKRFACVSAPHLIASAVAGWVGYGPFVDGIKPVTETAELRDDYTLLRLMRTHDVRYAMADYWTSYRLTLLFREERIVVPSNAAEDRYPPYRRALEREPKFAYVFDPNRSREDFEAAARDLRAHNARVELLVAGDLQVLVVTR